MGGVRDVSRVPSFKLKSSWVTILQGVEFSIFLLILAWALQQCSATALPVIYERTVCLTRRAVITRSSRNVTAMKYSIGFGVGR